MVGLSAFVWCTPACDAPTASQPPARQQFGYVTNGLAKSLRMSQPSVDAELFLAVIRQFVIRDLEVIEAGTEGCDSPISGWEG